MDAWDAEVAKCLAQRRDVPPAQVVRALAELARSVPQDRGDAWFDRNPGWRELREEVMALYYSHILANEHGEAQRLLASGAGPGTGFRAVAGEAGRVAYDRVSDMFRHVDFSRCRRFAMVGCGPLPVTALHVMERAGVQECIVLDVSPTAVETVEALRRKFGWNALQPRVCSGESFDYAAADVVYVANMVRGKLATALRALATAPAGVQLVVREPYSLGRLWAEKAEDGLAGRAEVHAYGAVSGHLSRDVFMRRSASA